MRSMVEGVATRTNSTTLNTARQLRRTMTLPEVQLWQHLRGASPRFRRQHPLGPYILDFYCRTAKLAVEIDGFAHATGNSPARDERRDAWLNAQGLTIMRIPAKDVIRDAAGIAEALLRHAAERAAPPPSASPPPPP